MAKPTKAELMVQVEEMEKTIESQFADIQHLKSVVHKLRTENGALSRGEFGSTQVQPFQSPLVQLELQPWANKIKKAKSEYAQISPILKQKFFSSAPNTVAIVQKLYETVLAMEKSAKEQAEQAEEEHNKEEHNKAS